MLTGSLGGKSHKGCTIHPHLGEHDMLSMRSLVSKEPNHHPKAVKAAAGSKSCISLQSFLIKLNWMVTENIMGSNIPKEPKFLCMDTREQSEDKSLDRTFPFNC